jgi:hypothetical protein
MSTPISLVSFNFATETPLRWYSINPKTIKTNEEIQTFPVDADGTSDCGLHLRDYRLWS